MTRTWAWSAVALAAALVTGCGGSAGSSDPAVAMANDAAAAELSAANLVPICSGSPETIMGVVESMKSPGEGLTIDTGSASVTVYGLGPTSFWSERGVPRPAIGDAVVAVVSSVTTTVNDVILTITVNGRLLELRDPATCLPLWRGGSRSRADASAAVTAQTAAKGKDAPPRASPAVACVGSPLSFSGIVTSIGLPGTGLLVSSADATETFYGLGPVSYWNEQGVSRPVAGDTVDVVASYVTTSDALVILGITLDGATLDLRDAGSCVPLW